MLILVISDNDSQVRIQAVKGLASLNHKKAVQPLIEFISKEGFKKFEFAEKRNSLRLSENSAPMRLYLS